MMLFDNRKLQLQQTNISFGTLKCSKHCETRNGEEFCDVVCSFRAADKPPDDAPCPPPPLLPPIIVPENHGISSDLIVMACVITGTFLLGACCIIILHCYSKWRTSRSSRSSSIFDDTHEDFHDEDHGDEALIVGLHQSVIDSIAGFKYKKDEAMIEGTECSICLSEFEEDESLRLLPKCSHAFHIPCIDTWLRSHKNCPLCRDPVVSDAQIGDHVSAVEPNSSDLVSREVLD